MPEIIIDRLRQDLSLEDRKLGLMKFVTVSRYYEGLFSRITCGYELLEQVSVETRERLTFIVSTIGGIERIPFNEVVRIEIADSKSGWILVEYFRDSKGELQRTENQYAPIYLRKAV